jgi:tryptophanyl-tRNA synthetase
LSGGQQTEKEQREKGADLSVDVSYKWLEFFLDDDDEFKRIGDEYAAGRMLTGEVKKILINVLQDLVGRHQRARAMVTDDVVQAFMAPRVMTDLWG